MKILVLASTFPRYENDQLPEFVLELSRNISKRAEVIVLAPHDRNAKFKEHMDRLTVYRFLYFVPGFETLAYRGGMVNRFKESFMAKLQLPFYLTSMFLYTLYIVITKRIEVIHAHWLFPQGFIAVLVKKLTGRKVIITTHGGDIAILNKNSIKKLLRNSIVGADKVTYVSKKNLQIAKESIGEIAVNNSALLPMGVYLPGKLPAPPTNNNINILFIGRLVAIKGLDVLIKSLELCLQKNKNLFLTVLGDGPQRNDLEELAEKLKIKDHVFFKGYIRGNEKYSYLQNSHIVIVPSIIDKYGYEEGLPVTALEAMAYGKTLIATSTGGLVELINGQNGILVEQNNVTDLAKAITEVANDEKKRQNFGNAALVTAKNYSWESITNRFFDLTDSLYDKK